MRSIVVIFFLAMLPACSRATEPDSTDETYDRAILKSHQIECNANGLLAFIRNRTLTETKIQHIRELIAQQGNLSYTIRERASKELLSLGPPVLKYLEQSTRDPDFEIADRTHRLIDKIKDGPGSNLPMAALRMLKTVPVKDAASVVIDYLPYADDSSVIDEAMQVLLKIGLIDGKADPCIRAFKDDPNGPRRQAVGFVLGRCTDKDDQAIARVLLKDADPMVRLRSAEGLLAGGHPESVAALIQLLNPDHEESTWRADDLLRRIACEKAIDPPADDKPETRLTYQKAWTAWWKQSEKTINLAKIPSERALLGRWVGVEFNTNSVWECGRDGKRRWTIRADGPMDAHVFSSNRVLIAESRRVTERDLTGKILWQFDTKAEAVNCQRLPNGNTFIATRHAVMEVRADKTVVHEHQLSEQPMNAAHRLPNGHYIGLSYIGVIFEMNPAGKQTRTVTLQPQAGWSDVWPLPGNRYLLSNSENGAISEVDETGKVLRDVKFPHACGLDPLPNGQLLVSGNNFAKIIDWSGKSFLEVKSEGSIRRIHRR